QGEKFDPDAAYVKKWIPELKSLEPSLAHRPWTAPGRLAYPAPILDLVETRQRALTALATLTG
ncbi:MAG: deoxyribodipyrimidine photo-lyase, partial [Methylobacteriaceae bacterium]|nr:deoxyribodipyrimidine photo-lyase [Methylobacteriaceae bacterium]